MTKLRFKFALMASMLAFTACSDDEAAPEEVVAEDGSSRSAGNELSAGLGGNTGSNPAQYGSGVGAAAAAAQAAAQQQAAAANTGDSLRSSAPTTTAPAVPAETYKVVASHLNVRKGPGVSFPVVRVIKKGTVVTARDRSGRWLKISENEFVSSKYVSAP